jgi:ATP-dependent Clp protease ATP-binding subunit ClpA
VFERFTERARQAVVLAQDEARALKHNYIGTEHLLLGLLREEQGLAARALESLDIELEAARAQVARIIGEGEQITSGQIPFTPRAKKVLELSMREARQLGHDYIGTEHVLLGLARENEGVATQIMLDLGVDAERIRNAVLASLSSGAEPASVPKPPPARLPVSEAVRPSTRRGERRRAWQAQAVVAGGAMFGIAGALGVLLGWLVWG